MNICVETAFQLLVHNECNVLVSNLRTILHCALLVHLSSDLEHID